MEEYKRINPGLHGEWIRVGSGLYKCSLCDRKICTSISDDTPHVDYPFCHCGADMRKGKD